MLPEGVSTSIALINILPNPPIHSFPSEKAKLYPNITHKTETTQARAKCCISTETTFFELTSPA